MLSFLRVEKYCYLGLFCVIVLKVKLKVSASHNTVAYTREKLNSVFLDSIGYKEVQSNCICLIQAFNSNHV